jgi:alcohol dehydrogenase (cytochrome c)
MKQNPILSIINKTVCTFFLLPFFSAPTIAQMPDKPQDWPMYNRTYDGNRYSPLKEITTKNVKQLHLLHTFNLGADIGSLQTGPVIVDGTMYFTTDTTTYAVDAASGKLKWRSSVPVNKESMLKVNRGIAFYENKIIRGGSHAHVYAFDAVNGKQLWMKPLDEAGPGVTTPMAPIAWNGMVFIGHAGGDNSGITGHVYALDVNDGHVIWKFNVVPDNETIKKTWTGALKGIPITGGCFWTSFTLDTDNGVLYVPSGNPAPDFDLEVRKGDNLYSNCVIALDCKNGNIMGYIQLVQHDFHDWDVSSAPTLITSKSGRKIIASANKDGLLSVIDRSAIGSKSLNVEETLKFIYAVPTTTRENTDVPLSREQFTHFKPGITGGSEWNGAAYNPDLDLIYVGAVDWGIAVKLLPDDSSRMVPPSGAMWFGGDEIFDKPDEARGWLTAFNAKDGSVRWKFKAPAPVLAGVTPTAGGLVFSAALNGDLYAFDAKTGNILWQTSTGLSTGGGIVSYAVNGKQYIAVAAGMKSRAWPGAPKKSLIMIYGL